MLKCDKHPQGKVTKVMKRTPSVRFFWYEFEHGRRNRCTMSVRNQSIEQFL